MQLHFVVTKDAQKKKLASQSQVDFVNVDGSRFNVLALGWLVGELCSRLLIRSQPAHVQSSERRKRVCLQ